MNTSLTVRALAAGYRDVIVRDVTFEVAKGEVFAIVGVNGAGKSTILKSIVGGAIVHGGSVIFEDQDITGFPGEELARMGIGYVPQSNDIFPGLTVIENMKMGGYLIKRNVLATRIDEALSRFPQLIPKTSVRADKLSGGERKQLAIARALIPEPTMLLLDEPTSNLSPLIAQDLLFNWVRELANDDRCVIVVEQRVEMVLQAADRACLIGGGKMQHSGRTDDMLSFVRNQGLLSETTPSS